MRVHEGTVNVKLKEADMMRKMRMMSVGERLMDYYFYFIYLFIYLFIYFCCIHYYSYIYTSKAYTNVN